MDPHQQQQHHAPPPPSAQQHPQHVPHPQHVMQSQPPQKPPQPPQQQQMPGPPPPPPSGPVPVTHSQLAPPPQQQQPLPPPPMGPMVVAEPGGVPVVPIGPGSLATKKIRDELIHVDSRLDSLIRECDHIHAHYAKYYEASCRSNAELHRQADMNARYQAIISQLLPMLAPQVQDGVRQDLESIKQLSHAPLPPPPPAPALFAIEQGGAMVSLSPIPRPTLPPGPIPQGPPPPPPTHAIIQQQPPPPPPPSNGTHEPHEKMIRGRPPKTSSAPSSKRLKTDNEEPYNASDPGYSYTSNEPATRINGGYPSRTPPSGPPPAPSGQPAPAQATSSSAQPQPASSSARFSSPRTSHPPSQPQPTVAPTTAATPHAAGVVPRSASLLASLDHGEVVCAMAMSSPFSYVFTGGKGTVKIWDVMGVRETKTAPHVGTLDCLENYIRACKITPDGKQLIVAGEVNYMVVCDIGSSNPCVIGRMETPRVLTYALATSNDSRICYSCCSDGSVNMWDLTSCKLVRTLGSHDASVTCCCITPDGQRLVTGSLDSTVRMWDIYGGKEVAKFDFSSQIFSLGYCPIQPSTIAVGFETSAVELL
ncbi:Transducin-like enhancer protein 4, partial [Blyttiomyces sp. JEL0837]